jgi:hypothetical protein
VNDQPTILFFNSIFGRLPDLSYLPESEKRAFTSDKSCFQQADAVVFHIPSLPFIHSLHKPVGQIWVLWSMESTANYPRIADPEFRRIFDLTMTYERRADVWTPYLPHRTEWQDAMKQPLPAKTETAPAVMFQSSPCDQSRRRVYISQMMKHIKIDSYGRVLNNRRLGTSDLGFPTKLATIGKYKFCIAMENSVADDYVTEKLYHPFLAGTVPVYFGAPNVDAFSPGENSFIHARDFSSARELAEYLNRAARDDAAYRRFFDWRQRPPRQSLDDDFERRGVEFSNLLKAVKLRMARTDCDSRLPKAVVLSNYPFFSTPELRAAKLSYNIKRSVALASGRLFGSRPSERD